MLNIYDSTLGLTYAQYTPMHNTKSQVTKYDIDQKCIILCHPEVIPAIWCMLMIVYYVNVHVLSKACEVAVSLLFIVLKTQHAAILFVL